jgi:TldD protein
MMKRALFIAACALAFAPALHAKPAPPPPNGPGSKAITDDILDAIAEEMNRQMTQLEIPGAPKPYLITYKITEVDVNDVAASLGQTTSKRNRHFVNLEARVRVGSPAFDNSNYVVPQAEEIDAVQSINLPLEATPRIARRATWLVTDAAYKEALMQLRAKLDARTAGGLGAGSPPVWSDVAPVVSEDPVLVPALEPLAALRAEAERLSAGFRDQPHLRDSRVAMTSYLERRWYLSSEGTSTHDTRRASGVIMVAIGQAVDGQEVAHYLSRYGGTRADLPSEAELAAGGKRLSAELKALLSAPVIDSYTGPVLFEREAAPAIVRWTLAPHLDGTPVPLGLPPADAKRFGGELVDKLGARVTAPLLSIVDDPTTSRVGGVAVIGGYKIDDEGVPAQRVEVVKAGTLVELLTARTVPKSGDRSNGHARRTAPGNAFHGTATNLIVSGKGGLTTSALEQKLLAQAKAAGAPYGLIITGLDDSAITATTELAKRELLQLIANANQDLPPPATVAYRLAPGGKRELVRGVQLAEIPVKAWRDVVAVGKTSTVVNFLASPQNYVFNRLRGSDEGFVPSSGIESSVAAPDLLFKELDVVGRKYGLRARPVVPPPTAP